MFVGLTIEDMVVGGPAFHSQELERGDTLLAVDGQVTALPSAPCALVRHPRASWLLVRASWLPWLGAFTLYK